MHKMIVSVIAGSAAALSLAAIPAAAQATTQSGAAQVRLMQLAQSDTPKQVTLDPATGAVISVRLTDVAAAPQTVTVHNPCQSGDACWQPNTTPYANYGFAGTGTKNGTWDHRRLMYTNNHSTKICWTYQGHNACSPQIGKNSLGDPGATVTGTQVTNYS